MFRGVVEPSMPRPSPEVHIRGGVEVPYTEAEMITRNAAYEVRKNIYDKTMKVVIVHYLRHMHT
jgi:hypothetical protein